MEKPFSELTKDDFAKHPVWSFITEAGDRDETWVRPVVDLPVANLGGCVVGTSLSLASGRFIFGVLGNISLEDARRTRHFLTVILFREDGKRFDLARYHDVDANRSGPSALAGFLCIPESDIFPMTYDISALAAGLPEVLTGTIEREPQERLTQDELITLAIG